MNISQRDVVCDLTTERSRSADIRWHVRNTPSRRRPPTASEHAQRTPDTDREGNALLAPPQAADVSTPGRNLKFIFRKT